MTPEERWLTHAWETVRGSLPSPPARVVELGCGALGGFVPMLRESGYEALGVDPQAPPGAAYRRVRFEGLELPERADALVASASLHHVADPEHVVERIADALMPGGTLVVVEWDWEAFDGPTAEWAFERLGAGDDHGWLRRRRDDWAASGLGWSAYLREWAGREGMHGVSTLLPLLDARFDRVRLAHGPYLFADLGETTLDDELAAIRAGRIRATCLDWVGRAR